jgi:signal transduction histidine kinase
METVAGSEADRQGSVDVAGTPARRRLTLADAAFGAFFAGLVLASLMVMAFGLTAVVAGTSAELHDRLHDIGFGEGVVARVTQGMADAAHDEHAPAGLLIDYSFSAFNLALAAALLKLRLRERTARLLAVGMVGTAAVFNLQAASVYHAMPKTLLESSLFSAHRLVAGGAYIAALLLFPDGKLIPRWPAWAKVVLYGPAAAALTWASFRPEGWEELSTTVSLIVFFGLLTPMAAVLAQGYRASRSQTPEERQQSKLLFWALTPALLIGLFVLTQGIRFVTSDEFAGRPQELPLVIFRIFQPVFTLIPIALFIGLLRYRLWNIDRIISRTVAYGVLAAFVGLVYVGVVVGAGRLVGAASDNLLLSIVATGIVAVAFQPVKEWVEHLANLLVYGKRATPYEVLSEFSSKMAGASASEDLLADMAKTLGEGTGAESAQVWLKVGSDIRLAASHPEGTTDGAVDATVVEGKVSIPGSDRVVEVVHHGELLGALSITKRQGEQITPVEAKLLADLASQAGVVFRNVRLTEELLERLEELKASRQRLVSAQDQERRRLERNLHDGAQQQLVALKVKLSLAQRLTNEEKLKQFLTQLQSEADDTLQTLRDLARGIYPPLLADKGLAVALTAQANKSPLDVSISGEVGRYSQEVEAAVYFCCLEALQNVAKYAGPCCVYIALSSTPDTLRFEVVDEGLGFDPSAAPKGHGLQNMHDRIDALGGELTIISEVGKGTTVSGQIPARAIEPIAEPAR